VLARRVECPLGIVEVAAVEVELAREAQRPAARLRAAALLGKQQRPLDQRRGAVELEP
jgi:hypothetical protein